MAISCSQQLPLEAENAHPIGDEIVGLVWECLAPLPTPLLPITPAAAQPSPMAAEPNPFQDQHSSGALESILGMKQISRMNSWQVKKEKEPASWWGSPKFFWSIPRILHVTNTHKTHQPTSPSTSFVMAHNDGFKGDLTKAC